MISKRLSAEIKEESLKKIREGKSAKAVAAEYDFHVKNIYNWVQRSAGGSDKDLLKISRLKRVNELSILIY